MKTPLRPGADAEETVILEQGYLQGVPIALPAATSHARPAPEETVPASPTASDEADPEKEVLA
jgi:hypothetical protein